MFTSRRYPGRSLTTRQYARLVSGWIAGIGLDPALYGTHSLRRTKATLIYRRTGNPLVHRQRRLLMTLYEDAFFSLTDYQKSPGAVLFFPKEQGLDGRWTRQSDVWQRGDYDLLSESELVECVDIFLAGRELARAQLIREMQGQMVGSDVPPTTDPGPGPLFS